MTALFASSRLCLLLLSAAPLFAATLSPRDPVFTDREWQDESVFQVNRLPPRASFFPGLSVWDALSLGNPSLARPPGFAAPPASSPWVRTLDGTWRFSWVASPEARPADFFSSSFDDSS